MTNRIVTVLILSMLVTSNVAYAAQPTQEEKDAKKAEREEILADKKAERDEKIAVKKEEIAAKKLSKMCERVEKAATRIQTQSQNREQKALTQMEQRRDQIQEKRTTQDEKLQERRTERDQQRSQFYTEMLSKVQNDEQTVAVEEFKKKIEAAVQVRRDAIDDATDQMRADVDVLITERVDFISELYASYQDDEDAILEDAESYCTEDTTEDDLKGMAKNVNTEIKAAREEFKKGINTQEKISAEVQVMAQVRKNASQQAIDEFKQVVEQARNELRASFGLDEVNDMDEEDEIETMEE